MRIHQIVKSSVMILLFMLGILYFLGGCAPAGEEHGLPTTVIESQEPEQPEEQPTVMPLPQTSILYERRLIVLEWPQRIRVGESDRIQLLLEVDENGTITPTVLVDGNNQEVEPIYIPDLYEDYYLNVESRLDIAGMDVLPQGVVSTSLLKGKNVSFAWSLSPRQPGTFAGTVWLHLNLIPKNGDFVQKELLFAKPIEIEGTNVLGLPLRTARWAGMLGTGTSFILGLPYIENILGWLFRRFKKTSIIKTDHPR